MSGLVRSLIGLALAQLVGTALRSTVAVVRGLAPRRAFVAHGLSATSALVTLALLYAASLGAAGLPLAVALVAALLIDEAPAPVFAAYPRAWTAALLTLAVLVLARPMTPTCWDEFVWLGKARLESAGFGTGVRLALDPHAHLMPPGYPTLWPAGAGWLGLGADDLATLTAAASLLVLVAATAFIEALARATRPRDPSGYFLTGCILVGAPLVLVHLRSTYVDLPLGLLGATLLLVLACDTPSTAAAASLATVLVGLKDEGAAHLAAALVGAALMHRRVRALPRAFAFAAGAGAVALGTWQLTLSSHAIARDHGGFAPVFSWLFTFVQLGFAHATELASWGVFWPAVVVTALAGLRAPRTRGLTAALVVNTLFVVAMLVAGPPRVRAFAENGTLLNRVLVQLWPLAATLLLTAVASDDEGSREPAPERADIEDLSNESSLRQAPAPDDTGASTG